jgi:zinc protease
MRPAVRVSSPLLRRLAVALLCLLTWQSPAAAADIQEVRTPAGIVAWLVPERSLPIVTIRFAFEGGSAQEPAGKEGVAGLLAAMLDQGAGNLSAADYQRQVEKLAARISFDSDRDAFFGTFESLSANFAKSVELLKLAVNAPQLEAAVLERTRAQLLAKVSFEAADHNKVANAAWMAQTFSGHAYARALLGTPDSIRTVTRDDLEAFRKRIFARRTLRVAAVGDIDAERLAKVIDDVFAALPAEPQLTPVADVAPATASKPSIVKIDGPQSVAVFGRRGFARSDPDYMPALVLTQILGGGSSEARLVREVREKRGLAYWVYSLLHTFRHASVLIGGVASPNADIGKSLDLVRAEFKALAEKGPTQAEVDAAKSYLIGSYVLSLDSNSKIAEQMLRSQLQGLGRNFIAERRAQIEKVTRADVARVARALLVTDDLSVAIAGQPAGLPP